MTKIATFLITILFLVPMTWAQERAIKPVKATAAKQALVIGNSNYYYAGHLRNPVNDARAIGSTLEELGFKVTTVTDASRREMDQAIRRFGKALQGSNGVGLFYYAGHGMQIEGENYLLPTDINPSNEFDVTYDAVPVGKLLGQMDVADNGMNVVILDACRNNPFARSFRSYSRGLAQVIAPTGTFISYATAPGSVAADGEGNNGLFTEKLLKHMTTPGLTLERVFKQVRVDVQRESNNQQVPWDSSSVTGDFFFVPEEDLITDVSANANGSENPKVWYGSEYEANKAWSAVRDSNYDIEVVKDFLKRFPKSQKAMDAAEVWWNSGYKNSENPSELELFISMFPESPQAITARAKLMKLKAKKPSQTMSSILEAEVEKLLSTKKCIGCDLNWADLRGVDLRGANLNSTNLSGANLSGANLSGANLGLVNLHNANLSGANLSGAKLPRADLRNANLNKTQLTEAFLADTHLEGADMTGTNLRDANLSSANLTGVDLDKADLTGAKFCFTTMPDGSTSFAGCRQ